MLTGMTPMLICADVQRSIAFYTDVIGLTCNERMDDVGKSGWASLVKGPISLMLASPQYFPEAPKVHDRYFSAQYYFYCDNLDELREHIIAKGFEPTGFVEQPYGMREFEMPDLDGHLLVFGQPMKSST